MATTHKPFRELVKPNSNFEFVGKTRTWVMVSLLLLTASVAMLFVNKAWRGDHLNWTIDFKGGTEIVLAFHEPAGEDGTAPADVGAADVRKGLTQAGFSSASVADFAWSEFDPETGGERTVSGMKVATPEFGAVSGEKQEKVRKAFYETFSDKLGEQGQASWSGDWLEVRSQAPFECNETEIGGRQVVECPRVKEFFAQYNLELKPWPADVSSRYMTEQAGIGEYKVRFAIRGIDKQVEEALEAHLAENIDTEVIQTYAVGARAGAKLRNDGIKSLFYAMALIMLYLAFRFDVRYAPGAVVALLHDAILVVGVFAVTWQPVSLTTVAALLTVIGYSVNDSVVIFDRIRENVERLKDKKFARVINISLNETMSRTLVTSLTTFLVTLAMNILGTGMVRNFAFAMNVGVIVGVYSSVFIAAPVALAIHNKWFSSPRSSAPTRSGKGGGRKRTRTTGAPKPKSEDSSSDD